ncbi:hypothetical protein BKA58DRAFT_460717 [Alternaria rosae]|uniref:uncharacterized protein n=1 Tax=Alternaria rosae TaxID=1187941 RepID=UPI001E8E16BE|nr:uncharacterized protein BKA58DRAFT_460717 [Alternaria rosae]KAH6866840.1 hypothetical protein BKA58DRAFT_460717 [Alternaria rosae]
MATPKPTYFLTPPRPSPPDGPIRLGAIIPSPSQPDEPLHLPSLPSQTDTSTFTEHNWSGTFSKSTSTTFGIWTSFLECVLGIGADISISNDKSTQQTWKVEKMTTQTFRPSRSFLEDVVRHEDVRDYITQHRFREKIYIITGVMIASSTTLSRERLQEKGVYVHAGVDATAWSGVPISVGPEGNWKRKSETSEQSTRAEDFVFAYRIREVKVRRKGGVKSDRLFDKGALFDTQVRRKVEDKGEVMVDGLGEEPDVDDVELESREVRQRVGDEEEEEDVVCVLPEPLD